LEPELISRPTAVSCSNGYFKWEAFLSRLDDLNVKIFADGADLAAILEQYKNPIVKGFTTNPTLMKLAGVTDYAEFARTLLRVIPDRPISFEVFADDFEEMEWQALEIASWGKLVVIKVPVTNTRGESSAALVRRLVRAGVRLNVTATMTLEQVREAAEWLRGGPPCYVSVFAGRVADTGRDPVPLMAEAVRILRNYPQVELIWASPRELLNVFQADAIGCHVITVTHDLLKKLKFVGKDLGQFSLETVQMFFNDAQKAGFRLTRGEDQGLEKHLPLAGASGGRRTL
jgi:transaldolase